MSVEWIVPSSLAGPDAELTFPAIGDYRDLSLNLRGLDFGFEGQSCTYTVQPGDQPGVLQALLAPGRTLDPLPIPPPGGTIQVPPYACALLTRAYGEAVQTGLSGVEWISTRGGQLGAPPKVTIYSIDGCPACDAAKTYLASRGVAFTVLDGSDLGEVPIIEVDGKRMVGFNRSALDAALGLGAPASVSPAPRDRVVALVKQYTGGSVGDPKFEEVTQGRADAGGYSACGDLINFVLFRLGCRDANLVNRDEPCCKWHDTENLSRPTSGAMHVGAWVPYKAGLLPKPGDLVLIGEWPNEIQHVFVVLRASETKWLTADYGAVNNAGQQSSSVSETVFADGRIGKWRRKLLGWIDIDHVPRSAAPDLPGGSAGGGIVGGGGAGTGLLLLGALAAAGVLTYPLWRGFVR